MKKTMFTLLMLVFGLSAVMAQRSISGTIVDAKSEPLIGASVLIQGTSSGTVSDANGAFQLNVPNEGAVLVISYTGYVTKTIAVDRASNNLSVTLDQDQQLLNEVVVTALGIRREAKTLGYGTASVSSDQINATKNTSALDALNGKVAGLSVSTASGAPGASTVLNIRGFNSVSGNNQPLYVIDGVPLNNRGNGGSTRALNSLDDFNRSTDFGNQMGDINPNDIENISILKGSAASALYGSRASNGVILITTKKGTPGRLKVDFNTAYSVQDVLRVPHLQNTYGQGWNGHFAFEENGSWGPKADGVTRLWGNNVNNSQQLKPFSINENNLRDFFDYGTAFNTGIGISGGNDNSTFRFSYSLADADGVIPTDADSYKRNTFNFSGGTKFDKFGINSSINYVNKHQKAVATGQGDDAGAGKVTWQEIIQVPRDHSIVDYKKGFDDNDPAKEFYSLDNFFTPYAQNPYWTLYNQGNNYDEDRIFGNLELSYQLFKSTRLVWRGGTDISSAFQQDWGNLGIITPGTPNSTANNVAGSYSELTLKNQQFNSDIFLDFYKKMNDVIDLSFNVGQNINARNATTRVAKVTNFGIPDYYNLANTTVTPIAESNFQQRRLVGVFGSATVGFKDWAYVTVGARNDWSSTLPAGNNSYFYPSASLSLVLSEAITMPDQIDFLKLRAGLASTGNDTDPYQILPVYIPGETRAGGFANVLFPFGGITGYELANNPGNDELKPELTNEYEFGIETKFFKGRVNLDANYFNRVTKDQIIDLLLEPASGYTLQKVNLGRVRNKGVELLVDLVPVRTKNIEWGINWNFTKINNEVEELGLSGETEILLNGSYDVDMKAVVGKPLGAIYTPQALTDPNGNIVVNPTTGLPLLSTEKAYRGSISPDFTMGFGTRVSAFGFTLGADADYRKGGVFYSYTARLNYFVGNAWNTQYNDREPWIIPGSVNDNGDGTFSENITPISKSDVFTYYGANDAYQYSHVLDRTFFKLRNVYLNYQIPARLTQGARISNASIGIFGRNLLIWTPSENHFVDPEANTFGTDLKSLYGEFASGPSVATYGIQLNLNF